MKLHIEPTTIKHLLDFLQNVRPLDIQEAELEGIEIYRPPYPNLTTAKPCRRR